MPEQRKIGQSQRRQRTEERSEGELGSTTPATPPTRATFSRARGRRISERRRLLGLSVRDVWVLTQDKDPEGKGIAPAQLARAEKGDQDLSSFQLEWLSEALDVDVNYWSTHGQKPVHVIRDEIAARLLAQVGKSTEIRRRGTEHETFIRSGHYKYIELLGKHADPEERIGRSNDFIIQAFLFEVRSKENAVRHKAWWPDEDQMPNLLSQDESAHNGEEFVRVLSGVLECWFMQPAHPEKPGIQNGAVIHRNDQSDRKSDIWSKVLHEGDSLHYSSEIHHAYRAIGTENATALFVYVRSLRAPALMSTREPES